MAIAASWRREVSGNSAIDFSISRNWRFSWMERLKAMIRVTIFIGPRSPLAHLRRRQFRRGRILSDRLRDAVQIASHSDPPRHIMEQFGGKNHGFFAVLAVR